MILEIARENTRKDPKLKNTFSRISRAITFFLVPTVPCIPWCVVFTEHSVQDEDRNSDVDLILLTLNHAHEYSLA